MDATPIRQPVEGETHETFETAAGHATPRVPVAGPFQRAGDVRQLLVGQRYESATHIVVREADTFLGMVTIEGLLFAAADASMQSLMDRGAPIVAPSVDQEVAAWRAVRHGESALAVVDEYASGLYVSVSPAAGLGRSRSLVVLVLGSQLPRRERVRSLESRSR